MAQPGPQCAAGAAAPLSGEIAQEQTPDGAQGKAERQALPPDLLHQAARKVVTFCASKGVSRLAVGEVRDLQTGVSLGKQTNQKSSQRPHGQFARSLAETAARLGMVVEGSTRRLQREPVVTVGFFRRWLDRRGANPSGKAMDHCMDHCGERN